MTYQGCTQLLTGTRVDIEADKPQTAYIAAYPDKPLHKMSKLAKLVFAYIGKNATE